MTVLVGQDPSLEHIVDRLAALESRARALIDLRRGTDPDPDDRFRGLYLSLQRLQALVDERPASDAIGAVEPEISDIDRAHGAWADQGGELRLRQVAERFDLDLIDTEILLLTLAPDVDARFEAVYGYLNDDVTRRRATVRLAQQLTGLGPLDAAARARFSARGQLVRQNLLVVDDPERPFLTRGLRVPDRVTEFVLGDDAADQVVASLVDPRAVASRFVHWPALEKVVEDGLKFVYVREAGEASGMSGAASAIENVGARSLAIDLRQLARSPDFHLAVTATIRDARMARSILVAGPIDALAERSTEVVQAVADARWPTVLVGSMPWDPRWARTVPLLLDAPAPDAVTRQRLWLGAFNGHGPDLSADVLDAIAATMPAFRLKTPQIDSAAQSARLRAHAERRPIETADLHAGARAQSGAGLDRLARRISPHAGWSDLIVPRTVDSHLRELAARARLRDRVLDEWQLGGGAARGRGITALFAGESGTGKTLAAEVIARELGLDVYVIDLSTVVDKYIGETEKNLDRIFDEADQVNGVLLFDEADAIFGKRSEVRDARDRYANVEVAYLLQRMERFEGLAVLTTNLRANIDDAFTRRIDVIVDFPTPDDEARQKLWRMHLPGTLPQAADIDLDFLARSFRVTGGNIRNICLTSAFLAAADELPVSMVHLIRGTEREYRKMGRLTSETEFGPYHALLLSDAAGGPGLR